MFWEFLFNNTIKRNIERYLPLYKKYLSDCQTILDVGCGNGMQAKMIANNFKNARITCLDVGDYLWKNNKDLPLTLYSGDVMPFSDASFDAVLLFFTLHHTIDPQKILKESMRVSKKYVLVFEEVYKHSLQKYAMIVYDMMINILILGSSISVPKFFTRDDWIKIFQKLATRNISEVKFNKPWYYPPQRILFVLTKD